MKPFARSLSLVLALLLGILTVIPSFLTLSAVADSNTIEWGGTPISDHTGNCSYLDCTLNTHIFDFSVDSIGYYATDRTVSYSGTPILTDGHVTNRPDKTFIFGSTLCVGDNFGLSEGYVSFDLSLGSGQVSLGVRNTVPCSDTDKRGLWFDFTAGLLTVRENDSGMSVQIPLSVDLSTGKTVRVYESLSQLTLTYGDTTLCIIRYVRGGDLTVYDAKQNEISVIHANTVEPTGYFSLVLNDADGWVDNVIYTNVEEAQKETSDTPALRVIDYATWTATDALGRTVSDNSQVGDPKQKRDVGLFYFLCWVGAGVHVTDNTRLYAEGGIEGVKAHYAESVGESYWGEPFFGYYRNTDTWVYRKHAYQLEAAGVDFIFLDVSNNEVFIEGHMALFDTWLEMRREGIDTPQICFFNGDSSATFESNMKKLFTTVYADENWDTYKELFYMWDGKPLIFGNLSGVSSSMKKAIQNTFTVRGNWAWCDKDGYWSWMQEYSVSGSKVRMRNGGWGRNSGGMYESLAVSLGHHATSSIGRSFVNFRQPNNKLGDYEFSSIEKSAQGLCFANEFNAVRLLIEQNIAQDQPFCMLITGWNEWIAGGTSLDAAQSFCNGSADFLYVDNFNTEFSRDAEPMRNCNGYGFGDNYYYQMVDIIRQYKGIDKTPVADNQSTVSIYRLSDWDTIRQTYMDSVGDVEHRNSISYDADYRYINNTGRNDFDYAKVSQDDNNLYFFVSCVDDIFVDNGSEWMNLFINADNDTSTGWNGFDYVLNRNRDSFVVTVEKIADGEFHTETVGGAYYAVQGKTMTVRVQKELLGLSGTVSAFTFKWADNSVDTTKSSPDPMDFIDLGDTAPDGRFAFIYQCESCTTTPEANVTLVQDTRTVQVLSQPRVPTDISYETKLGSRNVDYLFDAEKETAGIYITDSALATYFQHVGGTPSSRVQILANKQTNNKYMKVSGYSDLRTWNDVKGAYEVSVDLHMVDTGNSAVYIRGEMPGGYAPTNPRNFNITQVFNYFEWDWYAENGGNKLGGSSTAGSGIGIYPSDSNLILRIKRYAPDGLHVASASYTFPYPSSYEVGGDGWFNLHCIDDGNNVSILCNDTLICTVQMSQPGVTYESDGTGQEYYGLAVVSDANGKEVLRVENTRLNSSGSQIALTTRDQTIEFDNLYITYTELLVEGNHIAYTFNPTFTDMTDFQPDTTLMTELKVPALPVYTPEQETENAVTEASETMPETDAETDAQAESGCSSVYAFPVLLVFPALLWAGRKKEKADT